MIRKLVLKNWKSHEETELEFGPGTNILVGMMGAGKSAVLDAISFALFGKFPRQREVKLSGAITARPVEKQEAEVALDFDADGKAYSVRRIVKRKGAPEAEFSVDGSLQMSEPEKVTELVEEALKVKYDVFCRAIYSEQNRLDYFLLLPPKERKRQMDELLGIDRFGNARDNLVTLVNRLSAMRDERAARIGMAGLDVLLKARDGALKKAQEAELGLSQARAKMAGAKESALAAEKEFNALERAKREFDSETEAKIKLEGQAGSLEALAREKEAACRGRLSPEAIASEAAKANESLLAAQEGKRALDREISEKSGEAGRLGALAAEMKRNAEAKALLGERMASLENEFGGIAGARLKIAELAQAEADARAAEAEAARRIPEVEAEISALGKVDGKCPVCESPLEEKKRQELAEGKNSLLDGLGKRKAEAAQNAGRAKAEKERLAPLLSEMESAERKIAEISGALDAGKGAAERLGEARAALGALEEKRRMLERDVQSFSNRAEALRNDAAAWDEVARLRAKVAEAKEGIIRATMKIASARFNSEAYSKVRKSAEDARVNVGRLEGELRALDAEAAAAKERVSGAESALKDAERDKEELERISAACSQMEKVRDAVAETQSALRGELVEAINGTMAGIWQSVYPYRDYTGARLMPYENDYSLELKAGEGWVPVDGFASGGERACAALALRMAFAMVLVPNLRWLVLDEPTHNLDAQGIRALVDVLREGLPGIVDQVFVITHDEALKDAASARLYRFERDKEGGEPTRAIALN